MESFEHNSYIAAAGDVNFDVICVNLQLFSLSDLFLAMHMLVVIDVYYVDCAVCGIVQMRFSILSPAPM